MADATVKRVEPRCFKALLENAMEIIFTAAGTYTLPLGSVVKAIIPGRMGGTGKITAAETDDDGPVITLTVGLANVENSVIVCLE